MRNAPNEAGCCVVWEMDGLKRRIWHRILGLIALSPGIVGDEGDFHHC
jgi:hypothetical protein